MAPENESRNSTPALFRLINIRNYRNPGYPQRHKGNCRTVPRPERFFASFGRPRRYLRRGTPRAALDPPPALGGTPVRLRGCTPAINVPHGLVSAVK
ncbi:hypothetical protein EVAR_48798_1 [Eumeta japonica]|uniref:Uncharacterized protein n=1 Tax=Eumeta variegata TaxID=151549 RepID=A0A4C1XZI6_EUMVA|nr:hypothetical protein EVAR_48798_1 [Eumeta japonica]